MVKKRKKPGPPPMLARDRRTEVIRAKVTPPEAKAIRAAAGPSTVSDWARRILVEAATQTK